MTTQPPARDAARSALLELLPSYPPNHDTARGDRDTSRIEPPTSAVVRADVTRAVIDPATHADEVARVAAGAVVTFSGVVRDHDGGRAVVRIEYVAHPSAAEILARVVADVAARTDVDAVAVSHRLGELGIGDLH